MTAYDPNNPFAKILRGEFPCFKVYEDDHVLAFLDIMPRVPGHTLVIPKAPARNILDIKVEDYLHVARATHKIAAAAKKAFNADGITVQQFNEPAGGQVVFHLHVHVMPRHDGVALLPPASRKEDVKVLESNADQARRGVEAVIYSTTSSARATSDGEISRPSAFAALRLMIRRNRAGRSSGISAGLSPRKILAIIPAGRR